jgi:ribosome maturation factor RimP
MVKKKIEEIVRELTLPITDNYQFEIVDIEFKKEGPNWYLRLFVDKPEGINLEDCQLISDSLSEILDEVDPIEQSYILEVSSPGLDRPLKTPEDYEKYKGHKVEIKLYAPYNGQKKYTGKLIGLLDNIINLEVNNKERIEIPLNAASSVRLFVEF